MCAVESFDRKQKVLMNPTLGKWSRMELDLNLEVHSLYDSNDLPRTINTPTYYHHIEMKYSEVISMNTD